MKRCSWATTNLMIPYHDEEWGVPTHDDVRLFEFLTLEGAQAGLSWETILRKRERYREVFAGFDPAKVARFTPTSVEKLMGDAGIVRNRSKIESTVGNARAFLRVRKEFGSFDAFAWGFVNGEPIDRHPGSSADVPVVTPEAETFSKALRARGFKFVGPTICYAFMQATGMVNDHLAACSARKAK